MSRDDERFEGLTPEAKFYQLHLWVRGLRESRRWHIGFTGGLAVVAYLLALAQMRSCQDIEALQQARKVEQLAKENEAQTRTQLQAEEMLRRLSEMEARLQARP
jgi:hypothetical protein